MKRMAFWGPNTLLLNRCEGLTTLISRRQVTVSNSVPQFVKRCYPQLLPFHSFCRQLSHSTARPSPRRQIQQHLDFISLPHRRGSSPSVITIGLGNRNLTIGSISTGLRLPFLRKQAAESPEDVQIQFRLFQALSESPKIEHKQEVVSRFEELTQLFNSSETSVQGDTVSHRNTSLLKDDESFKLYLKCLASLAATSDNPGDYFAKLSGAPLKRVQVGEGLKGLTSTNTSPSEPSSTASNLSDPSKDPDAPLTPVGAAPTTPSNVGASTPSATSVLSPSALVGALFSGPGGRGKGGVAKVTSTGTYGSWGSFGMNAGGSTVAASGTGNEPIRVIVEEAKSPLIWRILRFVFVTALYSFLLLSLLSLLLDSSGILRAAQQTTPFTPTGATDTADPSGRGTTFKDVHGVEEAKHELYEIVEFLKDPKRFEKLGGRLPRGVLLTGPPGCGKTLLARAVAGEAGVNFFSASGSEFDEMYVGVGARRIRELFAAARKNAPSIIFIDELDAIGGKRSPRDQHYVKQTLNQLLVELDGFNPGEGVILIGATNLPESLDKALVRPGRFDRHVAVPLPDVRGRMQILAHHMRNIGYDKGQVDISTLARGTIGFSGADLQALVNQAAVKASADNAKAVRSSHFEWAKERIMMGAARKSAFISDKDKLATAYHEGGHALVALYTPGAYPLQSVTVIPRGMALGYTLMLPEMDKNSHSLAEYRAKLDVAMGGRVAEELIYGKENVTDGASSDIQNATSMASNMVRRFGFSDLVGPVAHSGDSETPVSPATQAVIDIEIRGLIDSAQTRAMTLLKTKKDELDKLAKALVEYETLNLAEVQKIVRGEKIEKHIDDIV